MSQRTSSSDSITRLLQLLPNKDEAVVQDVFNFYFQDLAKRAKRLIQDRGGAIVADEEDLAMLVMTTFLKDATSGELGELRSRHDVWKMLFKRVRLRAINLVRDEGRLRRNEVGESVFRSPTGEWEPKGIEQQSGRNIEELSLYHQELIDALADPFEKQIAIFLFEGRQVEEIATQLDKSPATVYRRLRNIKDVWEGLRNGSVSGYEEPEIIE
jgi:DNA-directed RNA polymerase specialized sigma24 family protein